MDRWCMEVIVATRSIRNRFTREELEDIILIPLGDNSLNIFSN